MAKALVSDTTSVKAGNAAAVGTDYFSLFGLAARFTVDLSSITSDYRELQKRFHPDRFATASERDHLLAIQQAAHINDAFETLKSPILRGEYLLMLRGHDMSSEHKTMQDTAFLMEQMELREQLEAMQHLGEDKAEFEIEQMHAQLQHSKSQLIQQLTLELDSTWQPTAPHNPEQQQLNNDALNIAAELLRKLKFYDKLGFELEQLEEKLLDF